MESANTRLKDSLLEYVANMATLQDKVRRVKAKQQAMLEELQQIRQQCHALRSRLGHREAWEEA